MNRKLLLLPILLLTAGTAAQAQIRLPVIFPLGRAQPAPPPPGMAPAPLGTPAALQSDLIVKAGSNTIYFPARGAGLDANAMATLSAQARWLLANPYVTVRLEGHGGPDDSRDYALAIGDKRANAARDFLVLQGVAPQRISVLSWGKERPGTLRIGTSLVAAGPRGVTIVTGIEPPLQPMPPFPATPGR
jgi:peptidoglycan-associated lipoprotein